MVRVSQRLVREKVEGSRKLERLYQSLESNEELQDYLNLCNELVVKRMYYNDHGITHVRIVAGAALEMLDILLSNNGREVLTKVARPLLDIEDSKVITLAASYLHDLGNMVHRTFHHVTGVFIAGDILVDVLREIYTDRRVERRVRQEVLHCVFAHDESVQCLTLESGVVKVADGTDMSEGRARLPYKHGKSDIHAFSALSIKGVEIAPGTERPIRIDVHMENEAGVFQVEEVLARKIRTSGIENLIEILMFKQGQQFKRMVVT
ncbi:MAG: HD domain-containing protein [Aigarchaeota archaeon]|nr:HD domain-containing protein [Aigarchaeota archaeon]MDW8093187.1 HD domain-containing protein [Nitrososphaerota archaeon]